MEPFPDPDWRFRDPSPDQDVSPRTRRGAGLEPPVLSLPSPAQYRSFLLDPPTDSAFEAVTDLEQPINHVHMPALSRTASPPIFLLTDDEIGTFTEVVTDLEQPTSHVYMPAVSRTVSSPIFVLTDDEISTFTELAPFLRDQQSSRASRPVHIDLTCKICLDSKLKMPGKYSQPSVTDPGVNLEPTSVLPCGHIFGNHCLTKYIRLKISNNETPNCPMCRFSLVHSRCRHHIPIRPYSSWLSRHGQLPLTIPEGGKVPPSCFVCARDSFEKQLDIIEDMIYPILPPNAYVDPMNNGLVVASRLRQEVRLDLLRQFHENLGRRIQW